MDISEIGYREGYYHCRECGYEFDEGNSILEHLMIRHPSIFVRIMLKTSIGLEMALIGLRECILEEKRLKPSIGDNNNDANSKT